MHHAQPKMSFHEENMKHAFTRCGAEDAEQETTLVEGSWRFQKNSEVACSLKLVFEKTCNNIHALEFYWIMKVLEKFRCKLQKNLCFVYATYKKLPYLCHHFLKIFILQKRSLGKRDNEKSLIHVALRNFDAPSSLVSSGRRKVTMNFLHITTPRLSLQSQT